MGWNNCTQQEAQDCYDHAKGNYQKASEEYLRNKQTLGKYQYDYSNEQNKYNAAASDKINFEKRIEGIDGVISLLEQNGYVNERVDDSNKAAQKLEDTWESYVICPDVAPPSITQSFSIPKVSDNVYSELALVKLKNEKQRLEQALAELNKQMQQMEDSINAMVKEMSAIQADQASLSKAMSEYSYEMSHYKQYL